MQSATVDGSSPPAGLGQHLVRRTLLIILLIVMTSSVPAVVITYVQLEHQVWQRIQAAQASTLALYEDERSRVDDMAVMTAQRPTLCALVRDGNTSALVSYLEALRQGLHIDAMTVITPDGVLASAGGSEWDSLALSRGAGPSADFRIDESSPGLIIVAVQSLLSLPDCDPPQAASLMVIRALDSTTMQTIAERTGVGQSLIIGNARVATSLDSAPSWPLNVSASEQVIRTGDACCTRGADEDEVYYLGLAPLTDASGQVIALSEVALPGSSIQAGMIRTVASLIGVTILATFGASFLIVRVARQVTQPLAQLAASAASMGEGDLETPITGAGRIAEIAALARHLDRARQGLRRSAQTVRRQRQRMETLLEATNDGVITLDAAGRVTSVSAAAERLLGVRAYDLLETRALEVFRPAPGEAATIADLLQPPPGVPPLRRLVVLNAANQPITLNISASWLDSAPATLGSRERVIVFRDVSEEAAVETLRSNFLVNISHEFRTPLAAVIASAEILAEECEDLSHEEHVRLLDSIQAGTSHLRTLVDNLLETASVEAGRFSISFRPTHLDTILDALRDTMGPLLRRRSQMLRINIPATLPILNADPDRLHQALINLVANASKFAPYGTSIDIAIAVEADLLRLTVLDCGPGLPGSDFSDLFKRFVKGPHTHGAQYGIGLGLWIVKAIVEAHGGEVGAANRTEGGARIWFTLPLKSPEVALPKKEHE